MLHVHCSRNMGCPGKMHNRIFEDSFVTRAQRPIVEVYDNYNIIR